MDLALIHPMGRPVGHRGEGAVVLRGGVKNSVDDQGRGLSFPVATG